MAGRYEKNTVDYFYHSAKHGKTIYILQQRFGNNGYAFWFKLLEELCDHENHYIELLSEEEIEFMASKMLLSTTEMEEILDLLAKLDAIDKELWKNHIIWCQNLVNEFTRIYQKRNRATPKKPITEHLNSISGTEKEFPHTGIRQSKVKKSRVEPPKSPKGGLEEKTTPPTDLTPTPQTQDTFLEVEEIKPIVVGNELTTTKTQDTSLGVGEVIPNLGDDPKPHIQIIDLFARAKGVEFKTLRQQHDFIVRHCRPARELQEYDIERIKEVMIYLEKNADFKWGLESCIKYLHEDLDKLKNKSSMIVGI